MVAWARFVVAFLAALVVGASSATVAGAQSAPDVELVAEMPDGVAFELLATAEGQRFRFHTDAMSLRRISIDCGEVSGKFFGMEQITWVEYGQVEVRAWETGETVATLSAGDAFGPTSGEASFYLASPVGRNATVYHFSAGGAGEIGDELPDVTYETTDCGSGATREMAASAAEVETLYSSDKVGDSMPARDAVFYVGLLTVEPGGSIGRPYATGDDVIPYTAAGSGVILPLVGGFGDGLAGQAGITAGPEVASGTAAWTYPQGQVALENFGTTPTVALLFGTLRAGDTIFVERHASR